jgi:glycosyltransferase involved in cell wall biosynthesis
MSLKTDLGEAFPVNHGVNQSGNGNVRWAVIAATSHEEAERYLAGRGLSASVMRSKSEVAADPLGFWRELRRRGIDVLAVHSRAWKRQRSSKFFEAVLALAPVNRRLIADGESQTEYELSGRQLALRLSLAPVEVSQGLGMVAREIAAFKVASRRPRKQEGVSRSRDLGAVVAIWHGLQTREVGGEVTHIAGILSGFRTLGLRIGLVTTEPPPPQLASILDDVEVVPPLPPGARLTTDAEELTMNRLLEKGALSLVRKLGPSLIYQRHRQFLWAGERVARMANAPLVLEWNNSEVWVRETYGTGRRLGRLLNPIVEDAERFMLQMADLTVAVSSLAADMALAEGADPARVAVIPNGVNVEEIVRLAEDTGGPAPGQQPLIGWVGAFGEWHGTEVLVRSLPFLRPTARLLLIGDGVRRAACESLASDLGVSDRIELTGTMPHDEAIRRLAQCDVLASPHVETSNHRFFGSPTKLFEYLAIGRPIVASRLEQLGEVLEDGVTARLVEPGDERQLALAIEQVLASPDRGQALGLAARREAERHSWDRRARLIFDRVQLVPGAATTASR